MQGALKVAMLSPGFVYEPYAPRESISFWKRWVTFEWVLNFYTCFSSEA